MENSRRYSGRVWRTARMKPLFRFVFKLTFNINYIQVQADSKLPVLYLIDSVMKNIGQPYTPLFVQNIEKLFASTFMKVNIILYYQLIKCHFLYNICFILG